MEPVLGAFYSGMKRKVKCLEMSVENEEILSELWVWLIILPSWPKGH